MSNHQTKTDNSYLEEKRKLRQIALSHYPNGCNILDCFSGDGNMYKNIDKKYKVFPIEIKDKRRIYLRGDNLKFLVSMDLSEFDIIDLDAYGMPDKQLKIIFNSKFNGIILITFIQAFHGRISNKLLLNYGYTKKMIKKCPSLLSRNGLDKFLKYLSDNNIKKIIGYFIDRRNYFIVNLKEKGEKNVSNL